MMRLGVANNQLIVFGKDGYAMYSGSLDKEEREEMACELLGAVYLLLKDDFNSHLEFCEFVMDNVA